MTSRKCELLARGYLGMCSAEEEEKEKEDETRQDSHPSKRHAARACAAGDFFLHDRESQSRRGRLRWQCKKEEGDDDKAKR